MLFPELMDNLTEDEPLPFRSVLASALHANHSHFMKHNKSKESRTYLRSVGEAFFQLTANNALENYAASRYNELMKSFSDKKRIFKNINQYNGMEPPFGTEHITQFEHDILTRMVEFFQIEELRDSCGSVFESRRGLLVTAEDDFLKREYVKECLSFVNECLNAANLESEHEMLKNSLKELSRVGQ